MIFKCTKMVLLIVLLNISLANYAASSKINLTRSCTLLTTLNINGMLLPRLLIDSGASGGIHLKEHVINNLPGNPAIFQKESKSKDVYGTVSYLKNYIAPQLMINGDYMINVPLTTFEMWGRMEERQKIEPIYGVIGLDTFGDKIMNIDLQKMTFEVTSSLKLDDRTLWIEIPVNRTENGLEINAIGDAGKRLRMLVDTGVNKSTVFANSFDIKATATTTTEVIAGKNQVIEVIRHDLQAPEFPLNGIDGFVGCDFFKGKRLVIAQKYIYISSR